MIHIYKTRAKGKNMRGTGRNCIMLLTAACDVLATVKRKTQQIIKREIWNNFRLFIGANCFNSFELPVVILFILHWQLNRGHLDYKSKLRQLK